MSHSLPLASSKKASNLSVRGEVIWHVSDPSLSNMARKLQKEAHELSELFSECAVSHRFTRASYADGTVALSFDELKTIQVVYFQVETYPASPALLMCEADEQLNGNLQLLNEQFEEYAVLSDVLRAVCSALNFESDKQILEQFDASMAEDDEDAESHDYSDGSASEDGFYDIGDGDDEDLMREVLRKVSRWTRLEEKRVQAEDNKKAQAERKVAGEGSKAEAQTFLEGLASRNQIFNMKEAFAMLSRELSDMMRDRSLSWTIDAIGDDAYHWEIAFTTFNSSSPLAQDLRQVEEQHGQSELVLRMQFKRGLHPFYPPTVQLVRPRCRAPLLGALPSHPMLQVASWDPWRSQKDLIEQLRVFLQEHARIAIESPLNAPGATDAYARLERLLAQLEAVTGILPVSYAQHKAVYSGRENAVDTQHLLALAPSNKRPKTADKAKETHRKSWAAGTGYGSGYHSSGPVWDAQKAKLAQDAQDAELRTVFSSLASAMNSGQASSSSAQAEPEQPELGKADISSEEAFSAIRDSCLIPCLELELAQASFTDMGNRSKYYTHLLRVVARLADRKHAPLLFSCQTPVASSGKGKPLFEVLCDLQRQAQHFLTVLQAPRSSRGPAVDRSCGADMEHADDESTAMQMAELIMKVHGQAQALQPEQKERAAASASGAASIGSDSEYVAAMRPMQLGFLEGIAADHKYRERVKVEGARPRARTVRLGKEIAGLNSDLPLAPASSVFVRVDEQNSTLWRALITGPAGTPYSGGCFMFDIYFLPDYPSCPPQVLITTTGGGSVRFGPNLYNCGKVCLSLLGTWSGGKGEGWDAAVSTTLQVLVSIQSLILVDEPYFCEPGYEGSMHTAQGQQASQAYSLNIREQTMHWAIWQQMKSPPKGFEDIVRTHFRHRQKHVLETCQQWVDEATRDRAGSAGRMAKFLKDIKSELAKL